MSSTVDNLPRRMNAVVNHGRGDFRYEELRVAPPGAEEVLVRVLTTGICGSDMDSIVTHRFPLSEFADAMDRVATHHGSMKVILEP